MKQPTEHSYEVHYGAPAGPAVWIYDGTDALLRGEEVIDLFWSHVFEEGILTDGAGVAGVKRDGEWIWEA